ncbi:Type I polyketide synthase OS=Lysinibacillus sphaericus OX=1421 GN=LS41612_16945 PE=4 SV=1 [Lysinibacillus sphaericus]
MLTISTKNKNVLVQAISQIRDYLSVSTELLSDIAYSTNITRDKHEYRFAIVGNNKEQIIEEIDHVLKNEDSLAYYIGQAESKKKKIAFLFTGQGSIYKDAAREFYENSQAYRETFDLCDNRFKELLGISIKDTLFGANEELLTNALYSQPIIFSWNTL